jgi:hypothetical protein
MQLSQYQLGIKARRSEADMPATALSLPINSERKFGTSRSEAALDENRPLSALEEGSKAVESRYDD